ncbi:unnamed protein product [Clonostachys rosea]|uniref:Uncharacterized protein n=1 Tax=Bionectria ochroleuca TaxID=29856 RepID=A0ABY6TQT8_BIOOC|nr:unnamed protein product [Clonostachys rosea]
MSLCFGKPLFLGTTCGIPLAGFDHNQVSDCMPTYPQIAPFGGDPRRNAQARLPVTPDGSKTRATSAKRPNEDQKKQPAPSRHLLTSTRGNPTGNPSKLARRTLRNRNYDYERNYQRQIADGRPDESWVACGVSHCTRCTFYDRMSMYYHKRRKDTDWREDVFVTTMLEVLGSAAAGGNNARGNAVSRDDLDSFIQSPPIRGAFWEFHKTCGVSAQEVAPAAMAAKLTGIHPAVVRIVRASLIGELRLDRCTGDVKEEKHAVEGPQGDLATLRKGGKRREGREKMTGETLDVHMCFAHYLVKRPRTWDLGDYLLQFCVVAESWRRYGLQRGCRWGFGGARTVADLMCAVLLNWWTMTAYDCFEKQKHTRLSINLVWDEWMDRYPRFLQGDEMEEQGGSFEEALHGVGRAVTL